MKTNIIIEKYLPEIVFILSSELFNVYEHDVTIKLNNKYYECYCEHMSGEHIVICENEIFHHENNLFYINDTNYILSGDIEWKLLEVKQTAWKD